MRKTHCRFKMTRRCHVTARGPACLAIRGIGSALLASFGCAVPLKDHRCRDKARSTLCEQDTRGVIVSVNKHAAKEFDMPLGVVMMAEGCGETRGGSKFHEHPIIQTEQSFWQLNNVVCQKKGGTSPFQECQDKKGLLVRILGRRKRRLRKGSVGEVSLVRLGNSRRHFEEALLPFQQTEDIYAFF